MDTEDEDTIVGIAVPPDTIGACSIKLTPLYPQSPAFFGKCNFACNGIQLPDSYDIFGFRLPD
jgi:hypothetical protein